jgi:hypothetical protein
VIHKNVYWSNLIWKYVWIFLKLYKYKTGIYYLPCFIVFLKPSQLSNKIRMNVAQINILKTKPELNIS